MGEIKNIVQEVQALNEAPLETGEDTPSNKTLSEIGGWDGSRDHRSVVL